MLKPTNDYPVFLQNLQYLRVIIFTIVKILLNFVVMFFYFCAKLETLYLLVLE